MNLGSMLYKIERHMAAPTCSAALTFVPTNLRACLVMLCMVVPYVFLLIISELSHHAQGPMVEPQKCSACSPWLASKTDKLLGGPADRP